LDAHPSHIALGGEFFGTPVKIAAAGTHVPIAERAGQTLEGRVRSIIMGLPWNLPRTLIPSLVQFAVHCINALPLSSGVNISGREALTGLRLHAKQLNLTFGEYVQITNKAGVSNNVMSSRTLGCIACRPLSNHQGAWQLFSLLTGKFVTAAHFYKLPTPDVVIEKMNTYAALDAVKAKPPAQGVGGEVEPSASPVGAAVATATAPHSVAKIPDVASLGTDGQPAIVPSVDAAAIAPVGADLQPLAASLDTADDNLGTAQPHQGIADEVAEHFLRSVVLGARAFVPHPSSLPCWFSSGDHHNSTDIINATQCRSLDLLNVHQPDWGANEQLMHHDIPSVLLADPSRKRDCRGGVKDEQLTTAVTLTPTTYHLSLNKGTRVYEQIAYDAIYSEISQIVNKSTFVPVHAQTLPYEIRHGLIRSTLFFKEKFRADGTLERLKARLVAGGDGQSAESLIGVETSSPTVVTENLMSIIAIAASERRHHISIDIVGAFLEAEMTGPPVHMVIQKVVAEAVIKCKPQWAEYVRADGTMVVRLKRALYGCKQSGKLWYDKLVSTLHDLQFIPSPVDPCVLNKSVDGAQLTLAVHVDDIYMTHVSSEALSRVADQIGSKFSGYKVQNTPTIPHLGLQICRHSNGSFTVDMLRYTNNCVKDWGEAVPPKQTPAPPDLFNIDHSSIPLSPVARTRFLSVVARLLYMSLRTRADIHVVVSCFMSRAAVATQDDWNKLTHLMGYLKFTSQLGIRFLAGGDPTPVIYSDASFACHSDMTSRSGVIVLMCGGPIAVISTRQKLVTRSSAEAELVALSDGTAIGLARLHFLTHQGLKLGPISLMEDNSACIDLANAGRSTNARTRHIDIRYYFVKQFLDSKVFILVYCKTADMLADILTKPLPKAPLVSIRSRLLVPVVLT
jgi:hypothetical protein